MKNLNRRVPQVEEKFTQKALEYIDKKAEKKINAISNVWLTLLLTNWCYNTDCI